MKPLWSKEVEEELATIIKDWLKNNGKTQADLRKSLQAVSTRMSSLIEVLKREYFLGGLPKVASRLCEIEKEWSSPETLKDQEIPQSDPFGQLDMLLQEIREDCEDQ